MMPIHRIDRFLTLLLFHPLKKILGPGSKYQLPILMYHSISDKRLNGLHPYFETATSADVFENQMKFLSDQGYRALNLDDAFIRMQAGRLPNKSVVITFDDGFDDFRSHAYPIIMKYGFTATVFISTDYVDKNRPFKGHSCLKWSEIIDLDSKGITFGSHTVSHPILYRLNDDQLKYEIDHSKITIESILGKEITCFSYPYAIPDHDKAFIQNVRRLMATSGYQCGVSTRIGTSSKDDDPFFLKRLPINTFDDLPFFQAKLEDGYNWLYYVQRIAKRIRRTSHKNLSAPISPHSSGSGLINR